MPRISAPTVAEHRVRQREALLSAATELLIGGGVSAVTPAAVGAAAGLSRPSVYQYFGSGAEILAGVIEDSFPRANSTLEAALVGVTDPRERAERYVRETLRLAADGVHRPATALVGAQLPPECRARIAELHREQAAPFTDALAELRIPEPAITARIAGGAIEAAMGAIDGGASLDAVTERTLAVIRPLLAGPAR